MLDILNKMEQTARETLPIPNAGDAPYKSIPRWNEDIEPYRKVFLALNVALSRKTTVYSTPSSDEEDQESLSFTHSEKQENAR